MEHLDTFLAHYPPFDALDPEMRGALAADALQRSYRPGEVVLVEDGLPAPGLWVLLTGSMELLHEAEAIQVLGPGECFGHPSLLSGMAPAFTVRAREQSTCALLSAEAGRRLLATEPGVAYVAKTMRKRLVGTGDTAHGLLDVGTTPISAIMRAPIFSEPEEPIRHAAGRLGRDGVSALLVLLEKDRLGIITDADVRGMVGGDPLRVDAPVRELARAPVPRVPVDQLAAEAIVDMVAEETDHMVVVDGERVCGVVSATDLLGLEARSPIALRHRILGAADEDELVRATMRLPRLFQLLVQAGVPPRELGRVLSLHHDAVVGRLIDFSIARNGPAPVAWAWLDLGSAARREFTLASDQDNALAYSVPDPGHETEVDQYFARLGADVNSGLVQCGIGLDNNGVLAGKRLWRMSEADWLRTFDEALREPDESHLIRATVAFDFRPAAGGLDVAGELTERIRAARGYAAFMRLLARTAGGYPVALGFRGQLATGRDGDPEGRLDIKLKAIIPVVNLVRFHALANGVTISPTADRIDAVASVGGIDTPLADGLREAFAVISRIRFEHHAALISAGAVPDNLIDPDELPPIARTELREALHVVRRAEKQLAGWVPRGR
jgi:CBS domain-containing protein